MERNIVKAGVAPNGLALTYDLLLDFVIVPLRFS